MEQIEALKTGFDGFDTEGTGIINPAQMQVIFKMMGNPIQVQLKFQNMPKWVGYKYVSG